MRFHILRHPLFFIVLAGWPPCLAQPQMNPDQTITFRLRAPNAKDVLFGSDTGGALPPGVPMTRAADGVWTYTTLPLDPGTYKYGFIVDGILTPDPANSRLSTIFPFCLFDSKGPQDSLLTELKAEAAQGTLHRDNVYSAVLGRWVQIHVYTPPGYVAANRTYPVLYLLHGAAQSGSIWFQDALLADRIADNLIAQSRIRELVLVALDATVPAAPPNSDALYGLNQFERYFTGEVIPLVESRYRIEATAMSRWVAGLSNGGRQAFHTVFHRPESFSLLGVFSASLPPQVPESYPALGDVARFNGQVRTFFACGTEDRTIPYTTCEKSHDALASMGIDHDWYAPRGEHSYAFWRARFVDFLLKTAAN